MAFASAVDVGEAAYALLEEEISTSETPWFLMSGLASLDEKHDRLSRALDWMGRAHAASQGVATRTQWGEAYVSGLVRFTPDNVQEIREVALLAARGIGGSGELYG